ncbi:MAG TPA: hypothetical protein VKS81_09805 [Bacteroidota bacterium]|nr:hypothetical protein [Bacteroidota bacterium]
MNKTSEFVNHRTVFKGIDMENGVGVWIDHRKAVIVQINGDKEEIRSISSGVEKHVRYSGGPAEDKQEHRFSNHLEEFYSRIITFLHGAKSILILGPGEAKGEFEKRLKFVTSGLRSDCIETADKMTDDEIAANVREHFFQLTGAEHQQNEHKKGMIL